MEDRFPALYSDFDTSDAKKHGPVLQRERTRAFDISLLWNY
jgi:hypothetical protein